MLQVRHETKLHYKTVVGIQLAMYASNVFSFFKCVLPPVSSLGVSLLHDHLSFLVMNPNRRIILPFVPLGPFQKAYFRDFLIAESIDFESERILDRIVYPTSSEFCRLSILQTHFDKIEVASDLRPLFLHEAESIKTCFRTFFLHDFHLISCWELEIDHRVHVLHLDLVEAESFLLKNLIFGFEPVKNMLVRPVVNVGRMREERKKLCHLLFVAYVGEEYR